MKTITRFNRGLAATVLLFAMFVVVGCAGTPRDKVAQAERIYTASANAAATLVESGAVKDTTTLKAIGVANDEANASLAEASTLVTADDKSPTAVFYATRALDAAQRFVDLIGAKK